MKYVALCLLLLCSTITLGQYTYVAVNVPGAVSTEARGINNNGEIVGFFKYSNCVDNDIRLPNCATHGFKYVNGQFIKLMVPNSTSTTITGVNDYGDLVGFYKKSDGTEHGFIWYHTNVVKTIDYKANLTVPWGINKAGTVVGGLWSTSAAGTFPNGGWVWKNGTFSNMNPSNGVAPCCESVTGISNSGVLSGFLLQSDFFMAWMKAGTDEDFFTYPGPTCCDTSGFAVNNNIDMIGSGNATGFLTKHMEWFEGTNDSERALNFTVIAFPGASATVPFGLNDGRGIVGLYQDSSGRIHGFYAKPN